MCRRHPPPLIHLLLVFIFRSCKSQITSDKERIFRRFISSFNKDEQSPIHHYKLFEVDRIATRYDDSDEKASLEEIPNARRSSVLNAAFER